MQRTVKGPVAFEGRGLHHGRPARARVCPAPAGHGIRFLRTDLIRDGAGVDAVIPALWTMAEPAELCTRLRNAAGVSLLTVEHLMAALAGLGIDNALVEVEGPELPILDGSARDFAAALLRRGLREQAAPLRVIEVLETVTVTGKEGSRATLAPADPRRPGLEIEFSIDFADPAIGRQHRRVHLANGAFLHELADSRTFCLQADVARMRANRRALGGNLANAVVFDRGTVRNPEGLRHADEPVRHKMLDALGDLALAGAPLLARYRGERASHALTGKLLAALFARPQAWRLIDCPAALLPHLPGRGLAPDLLRAVA